MWVTYTLSKQLTTNIDLQRLREHETFKEKLKLFLNLSNRHDYCILCLTTFISKKKLFFRVEILVQKYETTLNLRQNIL